MSVMERFAGVGTWAVVAGMVLYLSAGSSELQSRLVISSALLLAYLACMLFATRSDRKPSPGGPRHAALWLQLGCALALGCLLRLDFLPILSIIWIAIVPSFYGSRASVACLVTTVLAWYLVYSLVWGENGAWITTALYATFHVFALIAARTAKEAERAQQQAERLNVELTATQALLSEASRQSERTRIARDLHDLLGHHLTALTINLQIAERTVGDEGRAAIAQSRALARLLLSDVREAVSTLREQGTLDFQQALRIVIDSVPSLNVVLEVGDTVVVDDVEVAETLLRIAQESITNTVRHSSAKNLWITISQTDEELTMNVRDDGRAARSMKEGNGLTGMRERLRSVGGELTTDISSGSMELLLRIPVGDALASSDATL